MSYTKQERTEDLEQERIEDLQAEIREKAHEFDDGSMDTWIAENKEELISSFIDEQHILDCIDCWEDKLQEEAVEEINEFIKNQKKKFCCDKPMLYLGKFYNMNSEFYNMNSEGDEWLCLFCGKLIRHETITYDDEELFDFLVNCDNDSIYESKIYKELKEKLTKKINAEEQNIRKKKTI
jgi:hypothetical protein